MPIVPHPVFGEVAISRVVMGPSTTIVKDTMIHALMGTSPRVSKEALIHIDWSISTTIVGDTGIQVSIAVLQSMVEDAMIHVFITTPPIMAEAIIPPVAIPIGAGTAMIHVATALLLATVSHVTQTADATALEPFPVTLTESLPNRPSLQDVGDAAPIVAMIVALINSLLPGPSKLRKTRRVTTKQLPLLSADRILPN